MLNWPRYTRQRPSCDVALILAQNFTERGNFFGNSFHGIIIPSATLERSPLFGGNEPFLGGLAVGESAEREKLRFRVPAEY
jgi:hypothetical protein